MDDRRHRKVNHKRKKAPLRGRVFVGNSKDTKEGKGTPGKSAKLVNKGESWAKFISTKRGQKWYKEYLEKLRNKHKANGG